MENDNDYLIQWQRDQGWSITLRGHRMGTSGNIVEAIAIANRLAERDSSLHQRTSRVVFGGERSKPSPTDE
jgi:hypothetical protein